jgi:hypothetical protein
MKINYNHPDTDVRIDINDIQDHHYVVAKVNDLEYAYLLCSKDDSYGFVGMRSCNIQDIDLYFNIEDCIQYFYKDTNAEIEVFTKIQEVQKWFSSLVFPD